jgi:hypothetical protein
MGANKTGLAVGLNRGFIVTKPKKDFRAAKPALRKGKLGKKMEDLTL